MEWNEQKKIIKNAPPETVNLMLNGHKHKKKPKCYTSETMQLSIMYTLLNKYLLLYLILKTYYILRKYITGPLGDTTITTTISTHHIDFERLLLLIKILLLKQNKNPKYFSDEHFLRTKKKYFHVEIKSPYF